MFDTRSKVSETTAFLKTAFGVAVEHRYDNAEQRHEWRIGDNPENVAALGVAAIDLPGLPLNEQLVHALAPAVEMVRDDKGAAASTAQAEPEPLPDDFMKRYDAFHANTKALLVERHSERRGRRCRSKA